MRIPSTLEMTLERSQVRHLSDIVGVVGWILAFHQVLTSVKLINLLALEQHTHTHINSCVRSALRWHGSLSAKVTKNTNLRYNHDQSLS